METSKDQTNVTAELVRLMKASEEKRSYLFILSIINGREMILKTNNNTRSDSHFTETSKSTFFLTRGLLKNFHRLLSPEKPDFSEAYFEAFKASFKNFYLETTGSALILDKTVPIEFIAGDVSEGIKNNPIYDCVNLASEIYTLKHAVHFWLHPKAGKKNTAPSTMGQVNDYLFLRSNDLLSFPMFVDGEIVKVYFSNGLLPLCWAEIWYAIDHKIKAGVCPYCWDIFIYPNNNYQKAHCGSPECKRAHIINQHGGEEGYRKWESSRKKISTEEKRKKGRPKKSQ